MLTPQELRKEAEKRRAQANSEAVAMEHKANADERKRNRATIKHNLFGPSFKVFLISLVLLIIFLTWFGR